MDINLPKYTLTRQRRSHRMFMLWLVSALSLALSALIGCDDGEEQIMRDAGEQASGGEVSGGDDAQADAQVEVELDMNLPDAEPPLRDDLDPEGVEAGDISALELRELRSANFGAFTTSQACALCHSNHVAATAMRNSEDEPIGPYNLWQGTMMANASRDPFWWAQVSSEITLNAAEDKSKIERDCMQCHAPALAREAAAAGQQARLVDLKGNGRHSMVGVDGVACTTCHQILERGLGEPETFSGNYNVNELRLIFGPHENPATAPMQNHVNYTPTYGAHMVESKLCATCHTLVHEAVEGESPIESDLEGRDAWKFPEQTPYLEWRNSAFSNEDDPDAEGTATCQACHQPTYDSEGAIRTRIARSPPGGDFRIDEREPFGQHTFVGGNTVLPQIIKREREVLKPNGSDAALDMITALARSQLESAGSASIGGVTREGSTLSFKVTTLAHTGHKLPTGFPSRRVWLKVEVTSAQSGEVLFASGAHDERGRILDMSGEPLLSEWTHGGVEPHHQEITRPDQVQIYQAVMGDAEGEYTHAVTLARRWLKDNRLLPRGYRDDHPEAPFVKPVGVGDDPDFIGGQDQVSYRVELPEGVGALQVKVSLMYQTLSARFMRVLFQVDSPEVKAFRSMYERADVGPVLMSETLIDVP